MYCFGSGRIGHGKFSDIKVPKLLYFNKLNNIDIEIVPPEENNPETNTGEGIEDLEFIDFCAGRSHSLVVDNKNRVWVFGEGGSGELGNNGLSFSKYPILNKQLENEKIIKVSCWNQSFAISNTGKVWVWGVNTDILIPIEIPFKYSIKSIYCSLNNSIAVSHNGMAFIGFDFINDDDSGGRGGGSRKPIQYFVDNNIEIQQVACGVKHYLFLTNKGEVYSMGSISTGHNEEEQEAEEEEELFNILIPKKIKQLKNIIEISCGYYNSLALDECQKQVYGWGENLNGQLGMEGIDYLATPTLIELPLVDIEHISSGAYHSAFVTSDGELIVMGGALIVIDDYRLSIALGNGGGGFNTIQFKVDTNLEETVISENIILPKPACQLINIETTKSDIATAEGNNHHNDQDDDNDDGDKNNNDVQNKQTHYLTEEEILEFQYHFNELSHYDSARYQFSPQFIESLNRVVIDKVSCGIFHTMATLKRNNSNQIKQQMAETKNITSAVIPSLQNYCINYISNNIIKSMESDTSFQEINTLPINTVLKIDSFLTLNRIHNDRSQRLMSYLKSSFKQNTTSTTTISTVDNNSNELSNQWNQYLDCFSKDFEASIIVTLNNFEVLAKTNGFEISIEIIKDIINGFREYREYIKQQGLQKQQQQQQQQEQQDDESSSKCLFENYKIKIPKYQEFVIINLTVDKLVAINKKYTIVIDKTNLLMVFSIFKRSLLIQSNILKDFENIILDLKIHGY